MASEFELRHCGSPPCLLMQKPSWQSRNPANHHQFLITFYFYLGFLIASFKAACFVVVDSMLNAMEHCVMGRPWAFPDGSCEIH